MSEYYSSSKKPLPTKETASLIPSIAKETNNNQDGNLNHALAYLHRGYAPIPVGLDKKPFLHTWKEFQHRLPTLDEIRGWWRQWPEANIALVCGHRGFVVLDIDVKGHPERKELADKIIAGLTDFVPIVQTPSGGYHAYFTETNATSKSRVIPGLGDFQATGKYVLVPPSKGYKQINELGEPFTVPNDAWGFLMDYLQSYGVEIVQEQITKPKAIEKTILEGTRNSSLTSIGGKLRQIGLESVELTATLHTINTTRCQPPLSEQEVGQIANSVSRYPIGNLTSNAIGIPLEVGFEREVNAGELQAKALQSRTPLPYLPLLGLNGYLVRGWSHLIAGYPKTGKTELVATICLESCGLGEKVLFFTEEPEGVWMERLKNQPKGLWGNITLVFAVGLKPNEIQKRIQIGDETIVIIDTTRNLLQLENENDNSEISRALIPHIAAARITSKTIIFLQHTRKGGGEHGHAISGGHAFLGIVDIALQLGHDPQSPNSSRRLLQGWGRIYEIQDLLYERCENDTYKAIGSPSEVSINGLKERILGILSYEEWLKTKEVVNELDDPKPSSEQVRRALESLAQEQQIDRKPPINQGASSGKTYKWRAVKEVTNL